jgi:AmmeMemoRadiSam system protein A/AmmeMemoRadiSam system protein B
MPVLGAVAVPHPPLIMPEVGRGEEAAIQKTIDSYRKAMAFVASLKPDTVVLTSPHAQGWRDFFSISGGAHASGDFSDFRSPGLEVGCDYDEQLAEAVAEGMKKAGLRGGISPYGQEPLDHASMIPLRFLSEAMSEVRVLRLALSGFSPLLHYRLGQVVADCASALGRRVVMIASGDLSHKLKEEGPYGFSPDGPVFDREICSVFQSGDFLKLLKISPNTCESAAECGYKSFLIMAGALDRLAVKSTLLSYEGPFGVGYAVATFEAGGKDPERCFGDKFEAEERDAASARFKKQDQIVTLARHTVEAVVKHSKQLQLDGYEAVRKFFPEVPEELRNIRASCFVTLHKFGRLRGCIGTLAPISDNLGEEIERNAVSACSSDMRFDPVGEDELPYLEYSVDVLTRPEPIESEKELNPKIYGVIVSKGARRGVLLPDLEGVDTVEQQVSIAKQKAGLEPDEPGCSLMRFRVTRHF